MPFMVHLRSRLLVQHFSLDLLGCHLGLCVLPFDAYVMRMNMNVYAYARLMFVVHHGEMICMDECDARVCICAC